MKISTKVSIHINFQIDGTIRHAVPGVNTFPALRPHLLNLKASVSSLMAEGSVGACRVSRRLISQPLYSLCIERLRKVALKRDHADLSDAIVPSLNLGHFNRFEAIDVYAYTYTHTNSFFSLSNYLQNSSIIIPPSQIYDLSNLTCTRLKSRRWSPNLHTC